MNDEARVRDLLASVARPVDVEGRHFKVDRERSVATILSAAEEAYLGRSASKSRWFAFVAVAATLAVAAAATLVVQSHATQGIAPRSLSIADVHGTVSEWGPKGAVPLAPGQETRGVSAANSLVTAAGSGARLRSSDGLDIELFENSRLALAGLDGASSSNVQLLAGSIRCQVPALAAGQQFSVATPDATVTVHGTAFSVIVSGIAEAAHTCVKVERGEVLVKTRSGENLLGAGQSWGCAPVLPAVAAVATNASAAPEGAVAKPSKAKERALQPKPLSGTLDDENRLFQQGLTAERQRDFPSAARSLEALLATYPDSPLAADARLALSRVKSRTSPP